MHAVSLVRSIATLELSFKNKHVLLRQRKGNEPQAFADLVHY
jgi:hypothetical protein